MIPKVIHYCWFGGNKLPELGEQCIASWKKYCPEYQIIEWNETNYDCSQSAYAREAYEEKNGLSLVTMPGWILFIDMEGFIWI